jgi:hypothetical protein
VLSGEDMDHREVSAEAWDLVEGKGFVRSCAAQVRGGGAALLQDALLSWKHRLCIQRLHRP